MADDGEFHGTGSVATAVPPAPPLAVATTAPADGDPQPTLTTPPSSSILMMTVVIILGATLFLLVIFDGIAVLEGKTTSDLDTLTSMIAGGFVGFLTPHVASAVKGNSASRGRG